MADTSNLSKFLTDVAQAIRDKKGSDAAIPAKNFDTEIADISTGIDTSDANATTEDIVEGKTAYVNGEKITGEITVASSFNAEASEVIYINEDVELDTGETIKLDYFSFQSTTTKTLLDDNSTIGITATSEKIANTIGLSSEQIVEGNTILGIEGTATLGDSNIKLFETIEEMQTDKNSKEGDLAIVYRNEIKYASADSKFSIATFPATVVLPSAISGYIDMSFRAVDSSVMFDCWGQLDASMFMMGCYTDTGRIRIQYESSDGINYTRTTLEGDNVNCDTVDFGCEIYYTRPDMWNDCLGKFILLGSGDFGGLYSLTNISAPDIVLLNDKYYRLPQEIATGKLMFKDNEIPYILTTEDIDSKLDGSIIQIVSTTQDDVYDNVLKVTELNLYYSKNVYGYTVLVTDTNTKYACLSDYNGNENYPSFLTKIHYSFETGVTRTDFDGSDVIRSAYTDYAATQHDGAEVYINLGILNDNVYIQNVGNATDNIYGTPTYGSTIDVKTGLGGTIEVRSVYDYDTLSWEIAPTQLTLSSTNQLLPGVIAYGSNGIIEGDGSIMLAKDTLNDTAAIMWANIQKQYDDMETRILTDSDKRIDQSIYAIPTKSDGTSLIDTSNMTDMNSLFSNCSKLLKIPKIDTSKVTIMQGMFGGCSSLEKIPKLDTSNATNMGYMFFGCSSLLEIPELDTSKVTNMSYMFRDCNNLSDDSLNNILSMCTNATSYEKTKTLKNIGLSSEQATKCTTLSNYQSFLNAGWTTGY